VYPQFLLIDEITSQLLLGRTLRGRANLLPHKRIEKKQLIRLDCGRCSTFSQRRHVDGTSGEGYKTPNGQSSTASQPSSLCSNRRFRSCKHWGPIRFMVTRKVSLCWLSKTGPPVSLSLHAANNSPVKINGAFLATLREHSTDDLPVQCKTMICQPRCTEPVFVLQYHELGIINHNFSFDFLRLSLPHLFNTFFSFTLFNGEEW